MEPGSGRLLLSARRPGAPQFGAPFPAVDGRVAGSQLEVNEDGVAALLYAQAEPCPGPFQCPSALSVRVGGTTGRLGRPQLVGRHAGRFAFALGERGHVAVAWDTEATPSMAGAAGIRVALRGPRGRFGSAQEFLNPARAWASSPSVAINGRGDAVVAWSQVHGGATRREQGSAVYASSRRAGRPFAPPEIVWDHRPTGDDGYNPLVGIDREGDATLFFDANGKRVAHRPRGGRFGAPRWLAARSGPGQLLSNPNGDQVAMWTDDWDPLGFAARRPRGGRFTAATPLLGRVFWSQAALDARGNLLTLGVTGPPGQRLVAGVYSRFGFLPQEGAVPPPDMEAGPESLDTNDAGAAIALYSLFPRGSAGAGPLMMLEREADKSAPALDVDLSLPVARSVAADVRCDELCRVSGALRLAGDSSRGSASATASATRHRTLRPGATRRLSLRLSSRTRAQIRKLRRSGRRVRIRAVIRAEDPSGNVRVRRRTLPARTFIR